MPAGRRSPAMFPRPVRPTNITGPGLVCNARLGSVTLWTDPGGAGPARLLAALRCAREAPHHRLGAKAAGERGRPDTSNGPVRPEPDQNPAGTEDSEAR